jgi:hypothetical protein
MPFLYRVSNSNPKDVKKRDGFTGTETTILPAKPNGGEWPPGSFCAARMDDVHLTPQQIKLALTRFRPPPAQGTPYLFRLEVGQDQFVALKPLPEQCFVGNGAASDASAEVIVTAHVAASSIDVFVGGQWIALSTLG